MVLCQPRSVVVETDAGEEYHEVVSEGDEDEEGKRSRHQPLIGMEDRKKDMLTVVVAFMHLCNPVQSATIHMFLV